MEEAKRVREAMNGNPNGDRFFRGRVRAHGWSRLLLLVE